VPCRLEIRAQADSTNPASVTLHSILISQGDKTPIDLVAAFPNETFTAVSANNGETVIEFTDFALMNLDYLSSWDAEVKFTLDGELVDDADSKVKITCGACLPTSGSA